MGGWIGVLYDRFVFCSLHKLVGANPGELALVKLTEYLYMVGYYVACSYGSLRADIRLYFDNLNFLITLGYGFNLM